MRKSVEEEYGLPVAEVFNTLLKAGLTISRARWTLDLVRDMFEEVPLSAVTKEELA